MKPKEYLNQIKKYDRMISQLEEQKMELYAKISTPLGFDYDKLRVKASKKDSFADNAAKYCDIILDIARTERKYIEIKDQIIKEIHLLDSATDIDILYKRYVEYKSLEDISVEMNYSYQWIRIKHGVALENFRKLKENKNGRKK